MHDEGGDARGGGPVHELEQAFVWILLIDAQAAFDRSRNPHRCADRRHAFGDQHRLAHQTGAEGATLHAVGRTADIEIDLVEPQVLPDPGGGGQGPRIGAAELQRHRVFRRTEGQEPRPIAVDDRAGGEHLGVEPGATCEHPMEDAAVAVRPVHHRCNT